MHLRRDVDKATYLGALNDLDLPRGVRRFVRVLVSFPPNRLGCYGIGHEQLAKALEVTDRQVRRYVAEAIGAGVLREVQRGHRLGNGIKQPSVYALCLPTEEPLDSRSLPDTDVRLSGSSVAVDNQSQPDTHDRSTGHGCPPSLSLTGERGRAAPPARKRPGAPALIRPEPLAWCGQCDDPRSRLVVDENRDPIGRCPTCHPRSRR